ncbi:hypothetical protein KI387_038462, partial [Taxus chinensis]
MQLCTVVATGLHHGLPCYTKFHYPRTTASPSSIFTLSILHTKRKVKLTRVLNQSHLTPGDSSEINADKTPSAIQSSTICGCGFCNRRLFLGGVGSFASLTRPAKADPSADLISNAQKVMDEVHPSRPAWYEKLYAYAVDKTMASYEAEVAGYKVQLLNQLKGDAERILELGIGTGPNIKYYASGENVSVVGIDPNMQMEKYARAAATAAGIPESQFKFIRA